MDKERKARTHADMPGTGMVQLDSLPPGPIPAVYSTASDRIYGRTREMASFPPSTSVFLRPDHCREAFVQALG